MRVVCVPSALLVRRGCVNPAGGRAAPVASKLSRYSDASGTSTNQSVSMTASTRRYSGCQKQKPPQHRCGGFVVVDVGGERGTYLRKIVLDFSSLVIDSRRSWESGTGRLVLGEGGGEGAHDDVTLFWTERGSRCRDAFCPGAEALVGRTAARREHGNRSECGFKVTSRDVVTAVELEGGEGAVCDVGVQGSQADPVELSYLFEGEHVQALVTGAQWRYCLSCIH